MKISKLKFYKLLINLITNYFYMKNFSGWWTDNLWITLNILLNIWSILFSNYWGSIPLLTSQRYSDKSTPFTNSDTKYINFSSLNIFRILVKFSCSTEFDKEGVHPVDRYFSISLLWSIILIATFKLLSFAEKPSLMVASSVKLKILPKI